MAFKPNYNLQRSERNRIKEARKQEKLQKREEEVARRRAAREAQPADDSAPENE
jgi:Spy/CpxP family protein refolding chaperone